MSGRGKDRRKPRSPARPHGHAKEALRASEERYGSVVAALAEGIVFMDADGRLRASNASAERILGLTAEHRRADHLRSPVASRSRGRLALPG